MAERKKERLPGLTSDFVKDRITSCDPMNCYLFQALRLQLLCRKLFPVRPKIYFLDKLADSDLTDNDADRAIEEVIHVSWWHGGWQKLTIFFLPFRQTKASFTSKLVEMSGIL